MDRPTKSGMKAPPEPGRFLRSRFFGFVSAFALTALHPGSVLADGGTPVELKLFVDNDDDDDNGVADGVSSTLTLRAATDVRWLSGRDGTAKTMLDPGIRLIAGDRPLPMLESVGPHVRLGLQALKPGDSALQIEGVAIRASAIEVMALDARGEKVDLATSHASISRGLPPSLENGDFGTPEDPDALRWVLVGSEASLPKFITLVSLRPNGNALDALEDVPLGAATCPKNVSQGLACRQTAPIRATFDALERNHPSLQKSALRAEVGGRLSVYVGGDKAASLRVGGPRNSSLGEVGRLRATVRLRLVRQTRGGAPPLGEDDRSALQMGRAELEAATALWGQCGIHLGVPGQMDVQLVDPPVSSLVAVGCELGAPASGGEIHFTVEKRTISIKTEPQQTPTSVAHRLAQELGAQGFQVTLSPNASIATGALRTVDLLVRDRKGRPVEISRSAQHPLSSDKSLSVCLGQVDLAAGLHHFNDFNASAGTLEERALIKAFDDGDPTTIDVYVVPSFASSGRIGESFIVGDGASIQNVVIVDRAGMLAGSRSFALAHELGHVLLDMPGHPDDFGVDKATSLMDADASDPTIFGPRRLSIAECERAYKQSGPGAAVPLLKPWPLFEATAANASSAPEFTPITAPLPLTSAR